MDQVIALLIFVAVIAVLATWPVAVVVNLIRRGRSETARAIAWAPVRLVAWRWAPEKIDARNRAKLASLIEQDLRERRRTIR